jgi:hypothetical protein
MSAPVEAPRRPLDQDELDALIEEARRRARRRRLGYATVIVGLLAAGGGLYAGFGGGGHGDGGGGLQVRPSSGNAPSASPPSSHAQAALNSSPCSVPGHPLTGDIDGDGTKDGVTITSQRRSRGCSYTLLVRTTQGAARYDLGDRWPVNAPRPDAPKLDVLVRLDKRPGLEIVADTWHGASTAFADVFALWGSHLVEMSGQLLPLSPFGRAFAYAGSVGHENGVDCFGGAGSGIVVQSGAGVSGDRLKLTRQFFRVSGRDFDLLPARTQRISMPLRLTTGSELSRRYPEFADRPFPSCAD